MSRVGRKGSDHLISSRIFINMYEIHIHSVANTEEAQISAFMAWYAYSLFGTNVFQTFYCLSNQYDRSYEFHSVPGSISRVRVANDYQRSTEFGIWILMKRFLILISSCWWQVHNLNSISQSTGRNALIFTIYGVSSIREFKKGMDNALHDTKASLVTMSFFCAYTHRYSLTGPRVAIPKPRFANTKSMHVCRKRFNSVLFVFDTTRIETCHTGPIIFQSLCRCIAAIQLAVLL